MTKYRLTIISVLRVRFFVIAFYLFLTQVNECHESFHDFCKVIIVNEISIYESNYLE